MTDIELAVLVASAVALIRREAPRLDGRLVPLVALLIACVAGVAAAWPDWQSGLMRAVPIFVGAVGGVSLLQYAARKVTPAAERVDVLPVVVAPKAPRIEYSTTGGVKQ